MQRHAQKVVDEPIQRQPVSTLNSKEQVLIESRPKALGNLRPTGIGHFLSRRGFSYPPPSFDKKKHPGSQLRRTRYRISHRCVLGK